MYKKILLNNNGFNKNDNNSNCFEYKEDYSYLNETSIGDINSQLDNSLNQSNKSISTGGGSKNDPNDINMNNLEITTNSLFSQNVYSIRSNDLWQAYNSSKLISDKITDNEQKENGIETIQDIIDNLINESNITEIDIGKDKIFVDNNKTIIVTSTISQKINEEINNITINLGQCENKLKDAYNISNNNSLYILEIIFNEEGMKIPKVEYEVYYPIYNNNSLIQLDLSPCKYTKIEISMVVKINDSLDKHNPKSDYYNGICSKTTSESGIDISLKDRRNEFIDNNMSLCEENCDLIEYNYIKEKVKCSCDIKLNIPEDYDIKFNKNDFFKSFTDINNIFNIKIMKCYNVFLKVNDLIFNYGFIIIGCVVIFQFFSVIIFVNVAYKKFKKEIFKILNALKINGNPIKKNKKKNLKIK